MADESYNDWRENEVKRVGRHIQMAAEAKLDREEKENLVEMIDERTTKPVLYRETVAGVMERRRDASRRRSYYSVPAMPWLDKK